MNKWVKYFWKIAAFSFSGIFFVFLFTTGAYALDMKLPWPSGTKNFNGGPHSGYRSGSCEQMSPSLMHGLDFGLSFGDSVLAVAAGQVTSAYYDDVYGIGWLVKISHAEGIETQYWHLRSMKDTFYPSGQVLQGEKIAESGNENHLHFEFRPNSIVGQMLDGYKVHAISLGDPLTAIKYEGTMTKGSESTANITLCEQTVSKVNGSLETVVASDSGGAPLISTNIMVSNCMPPSSGTWTINSSCTMNSSSTAPGNVYIPSGVQLTIPNGITLNADFQNYKLQVQNGGGVLVKNGGKMN